METRYIIRHQRRIQQYAKQDITNKELLYYYYREIYQFISQPCSIKTAMCLARQVFMKASPWPVVDEAPDLLSAYPPEPVVNNC